LIIRSNKSRTSTIFLRSNSVAFLAIESYLYRLSLFLKQIPGYSLIKNTLVPLKDSEPKPNTLKYPLEQWDHFIHITLHPGELINAINLGRYASAIWLAPMSEDKNVKMCLLQQMGIARKKRQMSASINSTHLGCINLSHTLSLYISSVKSLSEIKEQHQHIIQNYFQLQNKVHEITCFIEENFASYCDLLRPASAHMHSCSLTGLGLRFLKCKQILQQRSQDRVLLNIAFSLAEKFFSDNSLTISNYSRFIYLKEYVSHLERIVSSTCKNDDVSGKLVQILLLLNYNKFSFIDYLTENLKEQVNEIESVCEKISEWNIHLKRFKQLQHLPHYALFVNGPSVKKIMIRNIKEEINCLKAKETNEIASPSHTNTCQLTEERLLTSLSVAQLALFVRLLLDAGIIETRNQSSLLKKIAAIIQTPKTTSISEESLRSKFYSPQNTSIIIIKEHLLNMMNKLRSY